MLGRYADSGVYAFVLGQPQGVGGDVDVFFFTARVSAQIVGAETAFEISSTELKSPGLEIGNPASMMSTPRLSRSLATSIFSVVFN